MKGVTRNPLSVTAIGRYNPSYSQNMSEPHGVEDTKHQSVGGFMACDVDLSESHRKNRQPMPSLGLSFSLSKWYTYMYIYIYYTVYIYIYYTVYIYIYIIQYIYINYICGTSTIFRHPHINATYQNCLETTLGVIGIRSPNILHC